MGKCTRKLLGSIVELKRLAHLVVDRGVMLPAGIRSMTALEQLEGVDVFKQPIDFAQELGHLTYLRSISFFLHHNDCQKFDMVGSNCKEYMDYIVFSLSKLGKLQSLSFHVSGLWWFPSGFRKLCSTWPPEIGN